MLSYESDTILHHLPPPLQLLLLLHRSSFVGGRIFCLDSSEGAEQVGADLLLQAGVSVVLLPFRDRRPLVTTVRLGRTGCVDPVKNDESHAANHDDKATDQEDGCLMEETVRG